MNKINMNIILKVILGGIIFAIVTIFIGFKYIKKNDSNFSNNENAVEPIITDQFVIWNGNEKTFVGYLNKGNFYYVISEDFNTDSFSENNKFTKMEGLSNIKRVKSYSYDEGNTLLFITEDGKVYQYNLYYNLFKIEMLECENQGECPAVVAPKYYEIEEYLPLKDYKVDDILEFSSSCNDLYKVLLKDGTIIENKDSNIDNCIDAEEIINIIFSDKYYYAFGSETVRIYNNGIVEVDKEIEDPFHTPNFVKIKTLTNEEIADLKTKLDENLSEQELKKYINKLIHDDENYEL